MALVRRGNYSTIVLDVWERLGGNGGAGDDGESHMDAYLRSKCQPLSAVPTPWERLRAVIELGGGRPPRDSPLGGGRAPLEGAQRREGLELCAYWPRSHELPASRPVPLCACPADDTRVARKGRNSNGCDHSFP